MSLAARAARGRLPALRGRAAALRPSRAAADTEDGARRLRACGAARKGPTSSGPPRRPMPVTSRATRTHATRRAVSAPAVPARRLSACHAACVRARRRAPARLAPRARTTTATRTKTRMTTRARPTRAAAKGRKQLGRAVLVELPRRHRRRGDRKGSAISGTPRSGPQAVKDARSARLVEPIP